MNTRIGLQSRQLTLESLKGSDFFPPFEEELPTVQGLGGLSRRHVTTLSTQNPDFEAQLLPPFMDEVAPFATEPTLTLFRIHHTRSDHPPDLNPELVRLAGIADEHLIQGPPKQGMGKAFQERFRQDPVFREKRATNGLDFESRDPSSPWHVDLAGTCWNSQSVVLLRRSELMRRTFFNHRDVPAETPRKAIRLVTTLDRNRIEFSFPGFLHVLTFDLDRFYQPLRRHRAVCETLQKPHSMAAVIGHPPRVAAIRQQWGYGKRGEMPPSDWPFVAGGHPYSMYLVLLDPKTGLNRQYWLKNRAQVTRGIKIVQRLRDHGLRYMLARFDADYITHCLPLGARNRLARLTEQFQDMVRAYFDPDFEQYRFKKLLDGRVSKKHKPGGGHSQSENLGWDSEESDSNDDDVNHNYDDNNDDTENSKSEDRDENFFEADGFSSEERHYRIKLARDELVAGLEKISRLMIENCQAAVDAESENIVPVAYLDQKIWSSFFRRRLEGVGLRREPKYEKKASPPSWGEILDQMLREPNPKGHLGKLLDLMPENTRYAPHQEKLLFAILDAAVRRDKTTTSIEIYARLLTELQTTCENAYAALAAAYPDLLQEMNAMREQSDAWKKAQETELRLQLDQCCEKVGVAPFEGKALMGKAWSVAENLVTISHITDLELEAKAQLYRTWQNLGAIFSGSEILSPLPLDLDLRQRHKLWKLLRRPQKILQSGDTESLVLEVLRAGWPSRPEIEARRMAKHLPYPIANAISDHFWSCVYDLQKCDDLSMARTARFDALVEQGLHLGGWRQVGRLGKQVQTITQFARAPEEVFVDQIQPGRP